MPNCIINIVSAYILAPLDTTWYTNTMMIKIWFHNWQRIMLTYSQLMITDVLIVPSYLSLVEACDFIGQLNYTENIPQSQVGFLTIIELNRLNRVTLDI